MPENDSTGGKPRQKGLSKKGDRYLRSLLVNGAMAIVRQAETRPDKHPWVASLLDRMSAKQAAIAIARAPSRGSGFVLCVQVTRSFLSASGQNVRGPQKRALTERRR